MPALGRRDARATVWALADELKRLGVGGLYVRAYRSIGVLSISADLTVWSDGQVLRWREDGALVVWPAADAVGAAARLVGGTRSKMQ
jgi:hypothetical protein